MTATLAIAVPGAVADQLPIQSAATLSSAHFRITFDGDYNRLDFLPSARANDLLGFAERAYTTYTAMGYAPPVDDGDGNGLIELRVELLLGEPYSHFAGYVEAVSPAAATTAGIIHLDVNGGIADPTDPTKIDAHTVAHEVFTLFQWKIFHATNADDQWLEESTAEWAAFQVANTVAPWPSALGEADRALDCIGSECGYSQPGIPGYNEFYDRTAKSGWSFFQYLSGTYGADVVKQIWARRAADGNGAAGTEPVDEVLASKGSSLTAAFNGWVTARLNYGFGVVDPVTGLSDPADFRPLTFATIRTGILPGKAKTQVAAVGHLSARYLELKPGDGSTNDGSCFAAALTLTVGIPPGVTSAPAVYMASDAAPEALSVSGSTASVTLPWSTCSSSRSAYVSLPNATNDPAVNGNEFDVTSTFTIDPNALPTVGGNIDPPPSVNMRGILIPAPTSDSAPAIAVFGPEVITLSTADRKLRLIVNASAVGQLRASIGSTALGTISLRPGNNDVRFGLPPALLGELRVFAASNVLMLTSLDPRGGVGQTVTRRLALEASARSAKAKHKHKPKARQHHH